MTPGENGRILAFDALLELDQDIAPPHDNFSLALHIVNDNYRKTAQTEAGNYTTNEPARAEMSLGDMNAPGEEGFFVSDSKEDLLNFLLGDRANRTGQGEWIWSVVAQQSEPDSIFGEPDPDPGNDWVLKVKITIMRPSLTEVAVSDASN